MYFVYSVSECSIFDIYIYIYIYIYILYKRSAIVLSTLKHSRQSTLLIHTPKIISLNTRYLFCVYELTKYKIKHGSKKTRIFNEKRTDSTEAALFKNYDGES